MLNLKKFRPVRLLNSVVYNILMKSHDSFNLQITF